MNSVNLIGNLTRDPELRFTGANKAVCDFSIAINRSKDEVDYFDCTAWEKTAQLINDHFHKGKPIAISGRLTQERWEDRESGAKRSKVKVTVERIHFIRGIDRDHGQAAGQGERQRSYAQQGPHKPVDDQDMPF